MSSLQKRLRVLTWLFGAGAAFAAAFSPSSARANSTLGACGFTSTLVEPSEPVVIYWATNTNSDPSKEVQFDELFLSWLVGTRFNGTTTQYYQYTGFNGSPATGCNGSLQQFCVNSQSSLLGSQFFVSDPPPPTVAPDCAAEESVVDNIAFISPGAAMIVLQLGPGVLMSCNSACAYHSITPNGNPYMVIPYVTDTGCGGPTIYDTMAADLNHEYAELVTDPNGGGWNPEIGDPCEDFNQFPLQQVQIVPTGTPFPVTHAGIQPLWSNAANQGAGGCVFSYVKNSANFYVGSDGQVRKQANSDTFASVFGTPGARFTSALSVVTGGPPRYDAFAFDANGHLGHIFQNPLGQEGTDDWGAAPTGNRFSFRPDVATWAANRLDVFATLTNTRLGTNTIQHRFRDNGDSGWLSLGSPTRTVRSAPTAVSWGFSELDTFVVGSDGNLYQASSADGRTFTGWHSVGKPSGVTLTGDPDVASWGVGRLDVFLVNSAGSLSHFFSDNFGATTGWDTWPAPSGVRLTGSPTATGMGDDRLRVSAPTTTGTFVQYNWDFGNFTFGSNGTVFSPAFNATSITYTQ